MNSMAKWVTSYKDDNGLILARTYPNSIETVS